MKKYLMLLLAGTGCLVWAQTNAPVSAPPPAKNESELAINSTHGYFDGNSREMIYQGTVVVTYQAQKLTCERLTISIPANNEHPTNAVAETNVVISMPDEKGQVTTVTCNKATYSYSVINSVTNELIIFTGGDPMPKAENPQFSVTGDPLILNLATKIYSGENYKTTFKVPNNGNGSNATPFNFLK